MYRYGMTVGHRDQTTRYIIHVINDGITFTSCLLGQELAEWSNSMRK